MRSSHSIRSRGSAMVLVVAVVGLLAVIGTVYLVSARIERGTAAAMSTAINLDLARDAAMAQVQNAIGNSMLDAAGQVGGYAMVSPSPPSGRYGNKVARLYDYPEVGPIYGQAQGNNDLRDEPWLVAHLHPQIASAGLVPGTNDYSQLTAALYNPSTGTYSIAFNAQDTFNVVDDQTNLVTAVDATTDDPPLHLPDAFINLLPSSDASGIHYRVGVRILDTSRMANLNTGSVNDALTDPNGTNLTSLRLAPASGWPTPNAYFNTADSGNAANLQSNAQGIGRAGQSGANGTFSVLNWQQQMLQIESPADPTLSLFDLSDELELRAYGEFGTSYHIRPSIGTSATPMWYHTLSADPTPTTPSTTVIGNAARRNYTTYSFSREFRPYPDPTGNNNTPFTLTFGPGAYADGTAFKNPTNFTTDFGSPTQSIAPKTIIPSQAAQVWPTSPQGGTPTLLATGLPRISINPPVTADSTTTGQSLQKPSEQNWTSMYYVAMAATNVATAMQRCSGFLPREACSFAANYATSLWSGMLQDPDVPIPGVANTYAYYFPSGPSLVDATGICIRTAMSFNSPNPPTDAAVTQIGANFGGSATDLSTTGSAGGYTYVGYLAQPFINKIAAQSTSDGKSKGQLSITLNDSALELYNPYNVALSMRGYQLVDTTTGMNLDLTKDDANQKLYVPPGGFLIITTGTGSPLLAPTPTGTPPTVVVGKYGLFKLSLTGSSTLCLRRPYIARDFTNHMATVDRAAYVGVDGANSIFAPSAVPATVSLFTGRADPTIATSMAAPGVVSTVAPFTLGTTANNPTYNLYDRPTTAGISPTPIANIDDFNHIMRIGNVVDASDNPVVPSATIPNGLLTERLGALGVSPDTSPDTPAQYPTESREAIIYFDFWVNPKIFVNQAIYPVAISPPGIAVPTDPDHKCDIRAFVLLGCLAPIDRYSNFSISIGNGNPDITKLRIPGQINVNTASGDVLRALPGIATLANANQVVANILAYRNRKAPSAADPTASYNHIPSSQDYSASGTYPGLGIHSLAELLVPIYGAVGGATNMDTRDKVWADVYNLCTVRSDTFVVYGYLEAVKQNPNSSPTFLPFNNGSYWYTPANDPAYTFPNLPIDDPHNTGPLIRVARRRWVAIVDRSYCDYSKISPLFSLPRVVAIKDLPQ